MIWALPKKSQLEFIKKLKFLNYPSNKWFNFPNNLVLITLFFNPWTMILKVALTLIINYKSNKINFHNKHFNKLLNKWSKNNNFKLPLRRKVLHLKKKILPSTWRDKKPLKEKFLMLCSFWLSGDIVTEIKVWALKKVLNTFKYLENH